MDGAGFAGMFFARIVPNVRMPMVEIFLSALLIYKIVELKMVFHSLPSLKGT